MVAYNGAKFIELALDSLLAQTDSDFELVISDDCSSDRTFEICAKYASKDERIRLSRTDQNVGLAKNSNHVLRRARGRYFAWAADHDVWHPEWLDALRQALEEDPSAVVAYPMTERISEDGTPMGVNSPDFDTTDTFLPSRVQATAEAGEGFGNIIYGLFRSEVFNDGLEFPMLIGPDGVLLWRLTLHGTIRHVPRTLWYRRFFDTRIFDITRQESTVFDRRHWYLRLPYPWVNAAYLLWHAALKPGKRTLRERRFGIRLAAAYLKRYRHRSREYHETVRSRHCQAGPNSAAGTP